MLLVSNIFFADPPADGRRKEETAETAFPERVLPVSAECKESEEGKSSRDTCQDKGEDDCNSLMLSVDVCQK